MLQIFRSTDLVQPFDLVLNEDFRSWDNARSGDMQNFGRNFLPLVLYTQHRGLLHP